MLPAKAAVDDVPEVDPALPTARFRRQHLELLTLSNALMEWRTAAEVAANAAELTRRVARLVGALKVHAAMEEEALYPKLLEDPDPAVRTQARALLDEVGPISSEVFAYGERWRRANVLAGDPEGFVRDTRAVLRRLSQRVTRETMELYPQVDARGL